jgi:hypothetical protein
VDLSTEDRHLVAEHDDLDGQIAAATSTQAEQLEDSHKSEVRNDRAMGQFRPHRPIRENAAQVTRMTFSASTGSTCCYCLNNP